MPELNLPLATNDALSATGIGGGEVALGSAFTFTDGFENEAADSGVPDNFETSATDGTDGSFEVQTGTVLNGSQALSITANNGDSRGVREASQPLTATTGDVQVSMYQESAGSTEGDAFFQLREGGTRITTVSIHEDTTNPIDLYNFDGSSWQLLDGNVGFDEWLTVKLTNIDPSNDTATAEWSGAQSGSGTVNFRSDMTNGWETFEIVGNDGASNTKTAYFDDYKYNS